MSETTEYDLTANFGLKKPWDDADDDLWGPHVNSNMDLIDNLLLTRGFDASKYLPLAGGEMLGLLTLFDDPAEDMDAATKRYVDAHVPAGGPFLPLDGGEMLGTLTLFDDPAGDMDAATKRYVDAVGGAVLGELAGYLPLTGGTVQGAFNVVVPGIGVTPAMFTNGAAPPAIPAGALDAGTLAVAMSSTTGQQAEMQVIGIGSAPAFVGAFAGGTLAAPTPVNVNNAMVQMFGRGYDGTGWFNTANIAIRGAELWTATAHGTQIRFSGTPTGSTALAEWARFANGNLLIGSVTDYGFRLDVNGGARIQTDGGATNWATVSAQAIAVALPAPPANTLLRIVGANAAQPRILIDGFGINGQFSFRASGGTATAPSAMAANANIGIVGFIGYDGTVYSVNQTTITSAADAAWTATSHPTRLAFATTPVNSVGAPTEAMRITNAGNLLIGGTVDSGAFKLDVTGALRAGSFATTALLTNAANDAAAASAGVALNQFYRNGSVVMQRAA